MTDAPLSVPPANSMTLGEPCARLVGVEAALIAKIEGIERALFANEVAMFDETTTTARSVFQKEPQK